jgi:hypothetical protein
MRAAEAAIRTRVDTWLPASRAGDLAWVIARDANLP